MDAGESLNHRRWKAKWNCARRALQVAERERRKSVTLPHMVPYDLRHFRAPPSSPAARASSRADSWPGGTDRTRAVVDAVLGGPRTGCGQEDPATEEAADQRV
ncbi:hypothetical protein [Streptomyces sp. NPDC006971]|uniref:hypothetical protein n=1 Tax=Streptomyces sp. NPDC006971 TaxID=3154784 RepID=UPI00340AA07B